jgi:hypothetical protein
MATKTNYALIQDEWIALRDFLRSVDGDMEAKGMSAYLQEHGHIAQKEKGAKPGQDYLRYINKKSKVKDALQGGDSWEAFLDCQIKETEAKIEAQERTGKAKVLLRNTGDAERLKPRAVREPVEKEDAEGKGSVTQALMEALKAHQGLQLAPPELLEAGRTALERHAEMVKRRAHAKAERDEKKREANQASQMIVAKVMMENKAKREAEEKAKAEAEAPAPAPAEAPKPKKFGAWIPCAGDGTKPCPKKAPIARNTILRNTAGQPCCQACLPPAEEEEAEEAEEEEEEEQEE